MPLAPRLHLRQASWDLFCLKCVYWLGCCQCDFFDGEPLYQILMLPKKGYLPHQMP